MKKRVEKNQPVPATELFPGDKSSRPVEGKFARTAELAAEFPFAHLDENLLRRLSREDNLDPATGSPWIPKAISGQWPVMETMRGLWSYAEHRARQTSVMPTFSSMELCESAGHIPRKIQKQMTRLGVVFTKPGCGVDFDALLLGIEKHILIPVSTGDSAKLSAMGLKGLEEINTTQEIGLKVREEREALQRKALIEKGELLMAGDGKFAVWKLDALEMFRELFEAPVKTGIAKLAKTINRQHKTIIGDEEKSRKCAVVVTAAVTAVLDKLREKIPANKTVSEPEENS